MYPDALERLLKRSQIERSLSRVKCLGQFLGCPALTPSSLQYSHWKLRQGLLFGLRQMGPMLGVEECLCQVGAQQGMRNPLMPGAFRITSSHLAMFVRNSVQRLASTGEWLKDPSAWCSQQTLGQSFFLGLSKPQ